ncbi:MAG: hypothetical protein AAF959_00615 [Cyanobacteria bacterium P01_D01_bin.56]
MDMMQCVELILPSVGSCRTGVILHGEYSKTPLWFGEATYSDVYDASGGQLQYYEDEDGQIEAAYFFFDGFPLWAFYGDATCRAHIYYFDDRKILQGVYIQPVGSIAVQIRDLRMEPCFLKRHDNGIVYEVFDTLIMKCRDLFLRSTFPPTFMTAHNILFERIGLWFSASWENQDMLFSIGFFSKDWLHVPLQELGWAKMLKEREGRRAAASKNLQF